MTPEMRARITADMKAAAKMPFAEMLGFLSAYTARFDDEIRRGGVTRGQVRAYADRALEQVGERSEDESRISL